MDIEKNIQKSYNNKFRTLDKRLAQVAKEMNVEVAEVR